VYTAQHAASQAKAEASAAGTSAANIYHRKVASKVSAEGAGEKC